MKTLKPPPYNPRQIFQKYHQRCQPLTGDQNKFQIKVTTIKPTGVRGTNLGKGIINEDAIVGILGQNASSYIKKMDDFDHGKLPDHYSDHNNIEYYALSPEHLAEQIIYAINQPLGVTIADLTIRASGDEYIL